MSGSTIEMDGDALWVIQETAVRASRAEFVCGRPDLPQDVHYVAKSDGSREEREMIV